MTQSDRPLFIWDGSDGLSINSFLYARRVFTFQDEVASAQLHIFADTRYRLRVNGEIAGYGPARFYPAQPEYDSIDLRPFLRQGDNVVLVEVNSRGQSSYQAVPSRAGLIAWGVIRLAGGTDIDLSTPGDWLIKPARAWESLSPVFSFAQAATEIVCGARHTHEMSDPIDWRRPVAVPDGPWGALQPRSTPPLSLQLSEPLKITAMAPSASQEERRAFHLHHAGFAQHERTDRLRFAYACALWSPVEQEVVLGLFWGPHYLNGKELRPTPEPLLGNRENFRARCAAGWNLLYGEPEVLGISWGLQIAWPRSSGLRLAAQAGPSAPPPTDDPNAWCLLSPILPVDRLAQRRGAIPKNVGELDRLTTWMKPLPEVPHTPFPTRGVSWQTISCQAASHVHFPPQFPLTMQLNEAGEGVAVIDFGCEWIGHVSIVMEAPNGTLVDVSNDELVRADGCLRFYQSSHLVNNTDRWVHPGGGATWEGFHERGGRYVQINVRSPGGPAILRSIRIRRHLLDLPVRGHFRCGDPFLNWVWKAGVETQQASLHEAWVDPWREQGAYLGDTFVETLATRCYTAVTSPWRRCLFLWAQGQREDGQMCATVPAWYTGQHEDFTLIYVLMLDNLRRTGLESDDLQKLWPTIPRIFASPLWNADGDGLWTGQGTRTFLDWGARPEAGRAAANGSLNSFRVGALEAAASYAQAAGQGGMADVWAQQAAQVREALRRKLWLEVEGCFAHGYPDPQPCPHATAAALLFNVPTAEQDPRATAWLIRFLDEQAARGNSVSQRDQHLELYYLHYALEALAARHRHEEVLRFIKAFWGPHHAFDSLTLWEAYARGVNGLGSQCHGWAGAPMIYFFRSVLGINPETSPTARHIVLQPDCPILPFAEGIFPLADGDLRLSYRVAGHELHYSIEAPAGVTVELRPGPGWKNFRALRIDPPKVL